MGNQYVSRHVAVTATGAFTFANNELGTAEGIVIEPGRSRITKIIAAISKSITDVAGAGVTLCIRLSGAGISGNADIPIGGLTSDTTSTAGAKAQAAFPIDVDIGVVGSGTLTAQVIANGVDPGTLEVSLGLEIA